MALNLDVLERKLAQELLGAPLNEIEALGPETFDVAAGCDVGLECLRGGHEQRVLGHRISMSIAIRGRSRCCFPCCRPEAGSCA